MADDLVKAAGLVQEAGGEVITLKGQPFDRNGKACGLEFGNAM